MWIYISDERGMCVVGVIGIIVGILLFKWIEVRDKKMDRVFEKEWVDACKTKSGVILGFVLLEKMKWLNKLLLNQKQLSKKIQQAYGSKNLEKRRDFFIADQLTLGIVLFWVGMCVCIGSTSRYLKTENPQTSLIKPHLSEILKSQGTANRTLFFNYEDDGIRKDGEIQVMINPYIGTKKELQEYMATQLEALGDTVLGQNKSLNSIQYNLKLLKSDAAGIIHFRYQSSNQEVMTDYGELRFINPKIFGEKLMFKMIASGMWQGEPLQLEKTLSIQIATEFENNRVMEEWVQQQVEINIDKQNENEDMPAIIMPIELSGVKGKLKWELPPFLPKMILGMAGVTLLAFGVMILKQYELKEIRMARERQIQNEFPDFVQKLLLLLYTGMTISQALARMGQSQLISDERLIYDALQEALQLIQSGKSELEALEDFGRKIGTKEFSRFVSTILQGIRKGNGSMMSQIEVLGKESWDQRIINARQLGEKASSKLILPMGLILIAIIIMVITPAWVSIQI